MFEAVDEVVAQRQLVGAGGVPDPQRHGDSTAAPAIGVAHDVGGMDATDPPQPTRSRRSRGRPRSRVAVGAADDEERSDDDVSRRCWTMCADASEELERVER